ncbi:MULTISPECIES: hypothetical protein [unclassified Sphingomonas]|uniref:hypothetical protein n=1 Tax=unclassified Sphingomonas TaxID=196159 RepID=UPI00226A89DC|nr:MULTISPECIES: hypothetical protein [unclassified Sphingomonas]
MAITKTRRSFLGAAMALPAVAIVAPALATKPVANTAEWDRLCAMLQEARDAYLSVSAEHSRCETRKFAALAAMRPVPSEPEADAFDMDEPLAAYIARTKTPENQAAWQQYEEAKKAWNDERAAVAAGVMGGADQRWEAAIERRDKAMAAIWDYPATSLSMLRAKTELLAREYDGQFEEREIAALVADIRRLADREG